MLILTVYVGRRFSKTGLRGIDANSLLLWETFLSGWASDAIYQRAFRCHSHLIFTAYRHNVPVLTSGKMSSSRNHRGTNNRRSERHKVQNISGVWRDTSLYGRDLESIWDPILLASVPLWRSSNTDIYIETQSPLYACSPQLTRVRDVIMVSVLLFTIVTGMYYALCLYISIIKCTWNIRTFLKLPINDINASIIRLLNQGALGDCLCKI
jgi:hypothetical protein